MKHKHAELMALFSKDAMETDTPWERWEFQYYNREWTSLYGSPNWDTETQYRRKIKTININGYEVPEPIREPLQDGKQYWKVGIPHVGRCIWHNDELDNIWMKSGLVHLTEENAQAHCDALVSITKI